MPPRGSVRCGSARKAVIAALGLYALWVLATYLLEGLPRTLLRPEAQALRLAYTLVANVGVGIVGSLVLLGVLDRGSSRDRALLGFGTPRRTVVAVTFGLVLGGSAYLGQGPPSLHPVVVLNAFAQVFPVSAAEVLTCWALVGAAAVASTGAVSTRIVSRLTAAGLASVLFGVYHIAHSPPFNAPRMIALLTVVGLATSVFFFLSGDVYGTIVFHNFLATFGVLRTLAAAGALARYTTPSSALLGTALVSLGLIIVMHGWLLRAQWRANVRPAG
jgi:hypothetical protein